MVLVSYWNFTEPERGETTMSRNVGRESRSLMRHIKHVCFSSCSLPGCYACNGV